MTKKSFHFLITIAAVIIFLSVAGYRFFQNSHRLIDNTPIPLLRGNITPSPDLTGWKTYSNTNCHYSIQYPNDWVGMSVIPGYGLGEINSSSKSVDLSTPDPEDSVGISISCQKYSTDEVFLNQMKNSVNAENASFNKTTIAGQDAVYYSAYFEQGQNRFFSKTYHLSSNSKLYSVQISYSDNNERTNNKIYDQILSTFKFTDNNSISWSEAVDKIQNCEIKSASQSHDLNVTLVGKDAVTYRSVEPKIDEVFNVVNQISDRCPIISASE